MAGLFCFLLLKNVMPALVQSMLPVPCNVPPHPPARRVSHRTIAPLSDLAPAKGPVQYQNASFIVDKDKKQAHTSADSGDGPAPVSRPRGGPPHSDDMFSHGAGELVHRARRLRRRERMQRGAV